MFVVLVMGVPEGEKAEESRRREPGTVQRDGLPSVPQKSPIRDGFHRRARRVPSLPPRSGRLPMRAADYLNPLRKGGRVAQNFGSRCGGQG